MNHKLLFIFAVLLAWMPGSAYSKNEVLPLGELDAFWRNQPVLGPRLQEGMYMYEVPDYLSDSDFPYKRRPYDKEVLWADRLSVVRLLGGYKEYSGLGSLRSLQRGHVPAEGLNSAAKGEITLDIEKTGNEMAINLTVPEGTQAVLQLPGYKLPNQSFKTYDKKGPEEGLLIPAGNYEFAFDRLSFAMNARAGGK